MTADGYIRIDTKIDDTGVEAGLGKLTQSLKGFATAATAAFAAKIVIDFSAECINLASDLNEVKNVIDTTFGASVSKIEQFAKAADTSFGLSELAAKKYSGTMGAMLKSMGYAEDAAADMSTTLAGLAGDLASFYNLDTDEAFNKLRSGISGEIEPLKQLGINLSVATLEAYALEQGIKKTYEAMTEAEKAGLRYNYILQATADAQGDFAKTADSFANQTRILSLQFETLKTTIGNALLPMVTNVVSAFNDLLDTSDSVKNLTVSMNEVAEIGEKYDKTAEQVESVSAASKDYVARLKELEHQGLDTAEAQEEYRKIVDRLNTLIPDLNLTLNEQTGFVNENTEAIYDNVEAWKAAAMTEALKTKYQDFGVQLDELNDKIKANDDLLAQATNDQKTAADELAPIYEVLADRMGMTADEVAILARSQTSLNAAAFEAGVNVADYSEQLINLVEDYNNASSQVEKYTAVEKKNTSAKLELQQQMASLEDKVKDFLDGVDDLTVGTESNTKTTGKSTDAFKTHETAAARLIAKTILLNTAIAEQIERGTLSKETYDKLTAAGYSNLIQKDKETGAIRINEEAYKNLTAAQYETLIAQMKLEQSNIEGKLQTVTAALQEAAAAGLEMSMGYYYAAQAQSELEKQSLDYSAQIAELEAAKASIGSYTASVRSGGGATKSATEKMAEAFKAAVEKIDRALALGEIDQEEYWRQYKTLMDEHLKTGTEAWEDANYELLKGQKDTYEDLQDILDDAFRDGELSLKDYLAESERLRDAYFIDDETAWKTAAENTSAVVQSTMSQRLKDIKDEYTSALADIRNEIESLAKEYADIDLVSEIKDNEGNISLDFTGLGDLEQGITDLDNLQLKITQLQEMGISDSLLSEISQLDTADAIAYAQYLISMGEEGFAAYLEKWEERQAKAKELAEAFYKDALDAVETEYTDKILDALSGFEDAGYSIGADTAAGIAAGILSGQMMVEAAMAQIMQAAIAAGQETADINSPSKVAADELGLPLPQGAAVGVKKGTGAFKASVSGMMDSAIKEAQTAAQSLSSAFNISGAWVGPTSFTGALSAPVSRATGLPATSGLPKLAQGAVIPPNREFVALLGDQRNGTNIEAPLDLIKQAVGEAISQYGSTAGVRVIIEFAGDLAAVGEVLGPHVYAAYERRGPDFSRRERS